MSERKVVAPFGEGEGVDGALHEVDVARVKLRTLLHTLVRVRGHFAERVGDSSIELAKSPPELSAITLFDSAHRYVPEAAPFAAPDVEPAEGSGLPSFAPVLCAAELAARCVAWAWRLARGL